MELGSNVLIQPFGSGRPSSSIDRRTSDGMPFPWPGTWRVFDELAFGLEDDDAVDEPVACW